MYIRKWVWQMFYFCTYNNTSTVKRFFCHARGTLLNPHLYESVNVIHTMSVHSLECISIILCHLQRKSLIPSTCKLYSDLIWKIYFLIPTLLSVKLKIYIYLKVYYFIMKNIYFEKALLMCHLLYSGCRFWGDV